MIDKEKLRYVTESVTDEGNATIHQILNRFLDFADTVEDYETLRDLADSYGHSALALKMHICAYTRTKKSDALNHFRKNLARLYLDNVDPENSLFYSDLTLKENPDDFESLIQKAKCLFTLDRLDEEEEVLKHIKVLIDTQFPEQYKLFETLSDGGKSASENWQIHTYSCELGEWQLKKGYTYEGVINRSRAWEIINDHNSGKKFWDGVPKQGQTIIIDINGGMGDEFFGMRFGNWFKNVGMNPIFFGGRDRKSIDSVYRRNGHVVCNDLSEIPKNVVWVSKFAIPAYIMKLENKTYWEGPYIEPKRDPKNVIEDGNFKIGLKCMGNPASSTNLYRVIPINDIIRALPEKASIYCFDKEARDVIDPSLLSRVNLLWHRIDGDWDNTLDLLDQMDVVVTSDSSLSHVSGAMGKRTIMMHQVGYCHYIWRCSVGESTPWYGENYTVLKQQKLRTWKEPIERTIELINEMI